MVTPSGKPSTGQPIARPAPPLAFNDLGAQRRRLGSRIEAALGRVIDHGRYILGPEVAELEGRLAAFCGARHALGCANGTDALVLALRAKRVGPGDAVFVPSFTFAATAEAVASVGATPVFADVAPASFNLDPASLEAAVDSARRLALKPTAVIAVDLYGHPADYDAIAAVASAHGLWILADAAQSFGASYKGLRVGGIGPVTTTSFYPSKPLGCYGDGGAVFTDDPDLARAISSLRDHGRGAEKYGHVRIGMNSRLDTIQAAILIEKLAIFEDEIAVRRRIAERYNALLHDAVRVPRSNPGAHSVWAQYTILLDRRDEVAARLAGEGIPTAIHYPVPLHLQPAFAHCPVAAGGLGTAERLARSVLSLPMHPYLEEATQDRIVEALRRALATTIGADDRSTGRS
ncbi:MAG: DegT/DnrJ/EryC1/StrS family aminotransferase [Pseudomonadota bacterium]